MSKRDLLAGRKTTLQERTEQLYRPAGAMVADNALNNALVPHPDGSLAFGDVQLTRVGVKFIEDLDRGRWEQLLRTLAAAQESLGWWIGDLFVYGELAGYGKAQEVAALYGYKASTIHQFVWVARSVEFSIRREFLSFGHHVLVAGMERDDQHYWLVEAEVGGWSVAALRDEINAARGVVVNDAPSVRAFDRVMKVYHGLGEADRLDYVRRLRRWLDEIEG